MAAAEARGLVSSSREAILGSIRQALGRTGPVAPATAAELDRRLADHPVHVQPVLEGDLPARFVAKLEAVAGSVARVSRIDDVASAVLAYLDRHNLPREFVATDEVMQEFYETGNRPSALKSVLAMTDDPDLAAMGEAAANAMPMPNIPEMGSVWSAWTDAYQLILTQTADPEQAFKDAAAQIRNLIAGG